MSRCFPFPPPGYEKKPRVDATNSLTKEKQKEKKRKKDKDKEKREGKEKKEKERSKEKHKEKKDRKEKHKDREDQKEKHRDRDRDRDKDKEKNWNSNEKKADGQLGLHNEEKLGSNSLQNNEIKDLKYVQELARRIGNEDRASGSQMVQKIAATDQRRVELQEMTVGSFIGNRSAEREKVRDKFEDPKKLNGQRNHIDKRSSEKALGENLSTIDQKRVGAIAKVVEKDVEKQLEGKEKSKHKESDDGKGDKQKSRDQETKRKSKDKDQDKEKKKEEKAKKIAEQNKEQPKLKESGSEPKESSKDDPLDFRNIKPSNPLSCTSSTGEGNLGKRKELEINGYLLDNGNRPHKISRPLSSSHPVPENGKKLEPGQNATQFLSKKPGLANNHRVENKEQKINGLITAKQPNASLTRPLSASVVVKENGEASAKPPHPDLKYLNRVLSVPKLEEWPDGDDQEWLFNGNPLESKAPNRTSLGFDETQQVWAEAIRIDSADILALPYVIPF